jgi:1-acyl-sn-glycerol-3-phosphate acyltransferase
LRHLPRKLQRRQPDYWCAMVAPPSTVNNSAPIIPEPAWPVDVPTIINSICGYSAFAFFCLTLPLFLPVAFILPGRRRWWIAHAMRFAMRTVYWVTPTVSWRFDGDEKIIHGARVVVMNHEGMLDILSACALPGYRTLLAKSWVFKAFPLGVAARAAGICNSDTLTPDDFHGDAQAIMPDNIIGLFVFPEGRRSRSGIIERFRPGAFILAKKLSCPIIPVVTAGSRQGIRPGSFWIHPTRVRSRILAPMTQDRQESFRQFSARVRETIVVHRRQLLGEMLRAGELHRHLAHRIKKAPAHMRQQLHHGLNTNNWQLITTCPHQPTAWIIAGPDVQFAAIIARMLDPEASIHVLDQTSNALEIAQLLWWRTGDSCGSELSATLPAATLYAPHAEGAELFLRLCGQVTMLSAILPLTGAQLMQREISPLSMTGYGYVSR